MLRLISASRTAFAAFVAGGQTCVSATRILVHQDIFPEFLDRFVKKVQSIERRIGDRKCTGLPQQVSSLDLAWPKNNTQAKQLMRLCHPALNPVSQMGSLISRTHQDRVHAFVSRALERDGLRALCGGAPLTGRSLLDCHQLESGAFYPPTVLVAGHGSGEVRGKAEELVRQSEVWKEEVFGPVVVVLLFEVSTRHDDDDEPISSSLITTFGYLALISPRMMHMLLSWLTIVSTVLEPAFGRPK